MEDYVWNDDCQASYVTKLAFVCIASKTAQKKPPVIKNDHS